MAVGDGYGGLEHRASTALLCSRNDLPWRGHDAACPTATGPSSAWPATSTSTPGTSSGSSRRRSRPTTCDRESYTRLLWIFEGFTSYYDDLMLVRAGVIDARRLSEDAGQDDLAACCAAPDAALQSVAESSFDAWIKYYRQDENSPNAIVSYYAKGSLVALCARPDDPRAQRRRALARRRDAARCGGATAATSTRGAQRRSPRTSFRACSSRRSGSTRRARSRAGPTAPPTCRSRRC